MSERLTIRKTLTAVTLVGIGATGLMACGDPESGTPQNPDASASNHESPQTPANDNPSDPDKEIHFDAGGGSGSRTVFTDVIKGQFISTFDQHVYAEPNKIHATIIGVQEGDPARHPYIAITTDESCENGRFSITTRASYDLTKFNVDDGGKPMKADNIEIHPYNFEQANIPHPVTVSARTLNAQLYPSEEEVCNDNNLRPEEVYAAMGIAARLPAVVDLNG